MAFSANLALVGLFIYKKPNKANNKGLLLMQAFTLALIIGVSGGVYSYHIW